MPDDDAEPQTEHRGVSCRRAAWWSRPCRFSPLPERTHSMPTTYCGPSIPLLQAVKNSPKRKGFCQYHAGFGNTWYFVRTTPAWLAAVRRGSGNSRRIGGPLKEGSPGTGWAVEGHVYVRASTSRKQPTKLARHGSPCSFAVSFSKLLSGAQHEQHRGAHCNARPCLRRCQTSRPET